MGYIFICKANTTNKTTTTEGKTMTMQENVHGQYVQAEASSSATQADKLRTKIRFILDQLAEKVNMPRGMTLHGTVTNDRFGNIGLYVFLRDKDGNIHPGKSKGNDVDYIKETVGGRWVRLRKDEWASYYGLEWEAREIQKAVDEYKASQKS